MFLKLYYSSHIVECSGAFEHSDLSREFRLNLKFTSKFASRDLVFYIKPMRSDYYYYYEVIRDDSRDGSSESDFVWAQEVDP